MDDMHTGGSAADPREIELSTSHRRLKRLFELVQAAKDEWEQTMDCVPEMVILVDGRSAVRRCNRSFAVYLGKNFSDIIGREWTRLLRERGLAVQEGGNAGPLIREESALRWFELKRHPYTTKGTNSSSGCVITLSDVTIQKLFAEQLEEKNRQITESVRELNEKNAELEEAYAALKASQSRVLQQEKMASIGQLAAGVAHEINNPMGFITSNLKSLGKYVDRMSGFIRLQAGIINSPGNAALLAELREKEKSLKLDFILDDVGKIIEESLDGSERVRKIVQSLKSFSRGDDGKRIPADINECIESAVTIIWNEIKYKATLRKELGALPRTLCYPNQLNQVFVNLLMNAVHAVRRDREITVRSWHDSGSISASVSDTGCGIPADVLPRIFEPFFTTKEVGQGTGLGLSIAYDIMKGHGGDIEVASEPGSGTTFTLRIPIVEVP